MKSMHLKRNPLEESFPYFTVSSFSLPDVVHRLFLKLTTDSGIVRRYGYVFITI